MIKANSKKEFFDGFINEYLSRGFGNMTKREIDVLIFHQLQQNAAFEGMTNYEIARRLRTTPNKVKNLKYEAKIRFDNHDFEDNSYLLNALQEYFKNPVLQIDGKWLKMQIEDPMLMEALKAKMKENGSLYDGSFNSELVKLSANDYERLLVKLIYSDKKQAKPAIQAYKKKSPSWLKSTSNVVFTNAIKNTAGDGVKWIGKQTLALITGDLSVLENIQGMIN